MRLKIWNWDLLTKKCNTSYTLSWNSYVTNWRSVCSNTDNNIIHRFVHFKRFQLFVFKHCNCRRRWKESEGLLNSFSQEFKKAIRFFVIFKKIMKNFRKAENTTTYWKPTEYWIPKYKLNGASFCIKYSKTEKFAPCIHASYATVVDLCCILSLYNNKIAGSQGIQLC